RYIMWDEPVLDSESWAEPVSTMVKNEKTGAPGRRRMMTVSPLGRVFIVTRFSNDARSCAVSGRGGARGSRAESLAKQAFIGPPKEKGGVEQSLKCIQLKA